jgi:hypothetical protein
MRFEHKPWHLFQSVTELVGALGLVNHYVPVIELDSGLRHQGDHRFEGRLSSGSGKGLPMRFEGGCDGIGSGYLEVLDLCYGATGNRYLGADDVARFGGSVGCSSFGDHGEASGALGRYGVG